MLYYIIIILSIPAADDAPNTVVLTPDTDDLPPVVCNAKMVMMARIGERMLSVHLSVKQKLSFTRHDIDLLKE